MVGVVVFLFYEKKNGRTSKKRAMFFNMIGRNVVFNGARITSKCVKTVKQHDGKGPFSPCAYSCIEPVFRRRPSKPIVFFSMFVWLVRLREVRISGRLKEFPWREPKVTSLPHPWTPLGVMTSPHGSAIFLVNFRRARIRT